MFFIFYFLSTWRTAALSDIYKITMTLNDIHVCVVDRCASVACALPDCANYNTPEGACCPVCHEKSKAVSLYMDSSPAVHHDHL